MGILALDAPTTTVGMVEIRIHGRGGQGAVTTAELAALAAMEDGKFAQAFPSFGPERRGAPVTSFVRISDSAIRLREKVYTPNVVVVLDSSLLTIAKVDAGLKSGGVVILNTSKTREKIRELSGITAPLAIVSATTIAVATIGLPITNTAMLGALAKTTGLMSLDSLRKVIIERFGSETNATACERAYEETDVEV